LIGRKEPDFSLSGLKTAVRIEAEKIAPLSEQDVRDLCASFQRAIVESIIDRTRMAFERLNEMNIPVTALVIAGGVAANRSIRGGLESLAMQKNLPLIAPPLALCTDNGAMIAWAGIERLSLSLTDGLDFAPRARWPLTVNAEKPESAHV
jgi:N6-L-threonylcarbamoyladenine synthase